MAGSLPERTSRPLPSFQVASGEMHVWTVTSASERRSWNRLLDQEEVAAADRMAGSLKLRFETSRGALRLLLGRYLRHDPASLKFAVGPNGKPCLANGQLDFNLAHSGGMIAIAIGRDCEVGIDLEGLDAPPHSSELAAKFFSADDFQALAGVPPAMYSRAFLTMWVRKEALLKAEGTGIGDGLLQPVPCLESAYGNEIFLGQQNNPRSFYLYDIDVGPRFVGALAVSCRPDQIIQQAIAD